MFQGFENLEKRRLFTLPTITFSGGTLTVKGGSQSDIINVSEVGTSPTTSNVHLEVSTPERNFFFTNDYTGVKAITVSTNGKKDTIFHTGNRIHPKISGGGSTDDIVISDVGTGSSNVDGGGGDDTITLIVSTVNPPGTTATTVHGGDGKDQIFVNTGDPTVYDVANSKAVIYGDAKDDTIVVYNGNNQIIGDNGNDKYIVFGGTNVITDSGGSNTYTIGSELDPSVTGGNNDITAGSGVDTFFAYDGINILRGVKGNDIFHTYAGSTNTIDGGANTDTLFRHGGGGADTWTNVESVQVVP